MGGCESGSGVDRLPAHDEACCRTSTGTRMAGGGEERGRMTSSASDFEIIEKNGAELCYIIRAELAPNTTTFITPADYKQQVGFIAYPAGGEVGHEPHLLLVIGARAAPGRAARAA